MHIKDLEFIEINKSFLLNYIFKCTIIFQSLFSNVAFGFGCAYLAHYEESGEGATWSNIWSSPLMGEFVYILKRVRVFYTPSLTFCRYWR